MATVISIFVLAGLALLAITLNKTYTKLPPRELKRRARTGEGQAISIYKAAAYGQSLKILLWFFTGLFAAGFFVLITRETSVYLALLGCVVLLWLGFAWIPSTKVSNVSNMLAVWLASSLAWLLRYLQPVLIRLTHFLNNHRHITVHSGLYEKDDLINLIKRQKKQTDNRISKDELEITVNALSFGEKLVRDVLIPRRAVKSVSQADAIGPVLMDELHKNGHSRFPVYQDKPDNIIGMLYVHDLMDAKDAQQVKNLMKKDVYYVREDQPLAHMLDAFLKTKHHLFIVVNNFEEMVGIITIEDILEQILGTPILDEFDQYQDLRAVSSYEAQKEHDEHVSENKVVE